MKSINLILIILIFASCKKQNELINFKVIEYNETGMPAYDYKKVNNLSNNQIVTSHKCFEVQDSVDVIPSFPGGVQALVQYSLNILLSDVSIHLNNNSEVIGKINYSIIISENGRVVDCEIITDLSPNNKSTLKNAILKMPRWTPAIKDKKAVCYKMKIPLYINYSD